jgi:hypothetical protein
MRPQDVLLLNTESNQTAARAGAFAGEGTTTLHSRDLPNVTSQPFKMWQPLRMKTGLRNQPIGRRVSMFPLSALGTMVSSPNSEILAGR